MPKTLGELIKEARMNQNLSQRLVAEETGLSQFFISCLENNAVESLKSGDERIKKLFEFFGISEDTEYIIPENEISLIGEKLKEERKRRDLTKTQFASFCGVYSSQLSNIEMGICKVPGMKLLRQLIKKLNWDEKEIMRLRERDERRFANRQYNTSTIGELIRQKRKEKMLTQQELAYRAQINICTVTVIELGKSRRIHNYTLERIADELEIGLEELKKAKDLSIKKVERDK